MSTGSVASEVQWNCTWPLWASVVGAALAVLWIVVLYAREQHFVSRPLRIVLAVLRMAALAVVIALLLQPMVTRQRMARPRLVIVADRSPSMATADVPSKELPTGSGASRAIASEGSLSRLEACKRILVGGDAPIEQLQAHYDVDVITVDHAAQRLVPKVLPAQSTSEKLLLLREAIASLKPADVDSNDATRLGDAIDLAVRRLAGPRPSAVVVLSDGIVTQGLSLADAAARARTVGTPIYAVAIGSERPRPDVAVDDVLAEEWAFPGDRLDIEASLRSVGYEGTNAHVALVDATTRKTLAETDVTLPADGKTQKVRLATKTDAPGPLELRIEISIQPDEQDAANNRRDVEIQVLAQPIRLLLAAATPSFEYRALKSLLERDPAIQLHALLQDADAEYASVDDAALDAFPSNDEELQAYDAVVLEDVDPESMPRETWANILDFVASHGGGLALIAGPKHLPSAYRGVDAMRTLLPIELSSEGVLRDALRGPHAYRVTPTSIGLQDVSLQLGETAAQSAAIWAALPPVLWLFEPAHAKPGVQVLAEDSEGSGETDAPLPVILRHYVGAGEVLLHTTDETWRWRWRSDDRYFARYWGQAVRRLARGRSARGGPSLSTNRNEYKVGDPVVLRARLQAATTGDADSASVLLEAAGIPSRTVRLPRNWSHSDVFETTLRDLPAGEYAAKLIAGEGERVPRTARFVIAAPPGEMADLVVNAAGLAEAARATGGKFYNATTWRRLLEELPPPRPVAVERLPDEHLWNAHWLMALLCIALGSEWLLRRRFGML